MLGLLAGHALAAPQGGQVVAGQAGISQQGNTTRIDQSSQRAVIDWRSYSVGSGERVQYVQPNSQSATLNRVTGAQASVLLGRIDANGQVVLINPNGVTIGAGAQLNVGGLIVSTAGTGNAPFMNGQWRLDQPGKPGASISNRGTITATQGGLVALVAPHVRNDGVIEARAGRVKLHQRETVTLDLNGDALVNFAVPDAAAAGLGNLEPGTQVVLSVPQAQTLLDGAVNLTGSSRAREVAVRNGRVFLLAEGRENAVPAVAPALGGPGGSNKLVVLRVASDKRRSGLGAHPSTSGTEERDPGRIPSKSGPSPSTRSVLNPVGGGKTIAPPQDKPLSPSTSNAAGAAAAPIAEIVPQGSTAAAGSVGVAANGASAPAGRTGVRSSGASETGTAGSVAVGGAAGAAPSSNAASDVPVAMASAGEGGNWGPAPVAPSAARTSGASSAASNRTSNAAASPDTRLSSTPPASDTFSSSPTASGAPPAGNGRQARSGSSVSAAVAGANGTGGSPAPAPAQAGAPVLVASFTGGRGVALTADLGRSPVATAQPAPDADSAKLVVERPVPTRGVRSQGSKR